MDLPLARLPELLAYEAPYLSAKLLKLKVVRSGDEASALFAEVKKYLVLCELHRTSLIPMFSRRVDEVWHQFVLFTAQYKAFTHAFFGKFVHHDPFEAPRGAEETELPELTFAQFRGAYEKLFGPLSDAWFDELTVAPSTRILRATWRSPFGVRPAGDKVELVMLAEPTVLVCRVDRRATAALTMLVTYDMVHVRELPELSDADRVALCRALVAIGVLFVAP